MWDTIRTDKRININKSFFGLRTTAVYNPTNSEIDAMTAEFSPADGNELKRILESPHNQMAAATENFHPKHIANGNFLAEVCASRDESFVAVQLHQFMRMSYEPVTDVLVFEGADAHLIKQLF